MQCVFIPLKRGWHSLCLEKIRNLHKIKIRPSPFRKYKLGFPPENQKKTREHQKTLYSGTLAWTPPPVAFLFFWGFGPLQRAWTCFRSFFGCRFLWLYVILINLIGIYWISSDFSRFLILWSNCWVKVPLGVQQNLSKYHLKSCKDCTSRRTRSGD
jgi:hypothetical protein